MKKVYTRLLLLALTFILSHTNADLFAQEFPVDTILYNGDPSKFINLLFVGDGFQANELASYISNVKSTTAYLFTTSPFKEYKNYFNVFAIKVPSAQSGADHPRSVADCPAVAKHPVLDVDTYYNCGFDGWNHRSLVTKDKGGLFWTLLYNFLQYNDLVVLANTPYYGGTGGPFSTVSLEESSNDILVHELGHSFAKLLDEYFDPETANEAPNMTKTSDPATVKWKNWIGNAGVGVFAHDVAGVGSTWYRPHPSCKMRFLHRAFCPVCKETIVEKIHERFGSPIVGYTPSLIVNIDSSNRREHFKIKTIKPNPNTLKVTWKLNGSIIATNIDSIALDSAQLGWGANALSVEVFDTTSLTRSDEHFLTNVHNYSQSWFINPVPAVRLIDPTTLAHPFCCDGQTNVTIRPGNEGNHFKIYPNPTAGVFIIESIDESCFVNVSNVLGEIIYSSTLISDKTEIDLSNQPNGIYFIHLNMAQHSLREKLIIQK